MVNSQTREELVEELADLQAVIEQIKESRGIATQEMDEAVRKGMEKKGGFTRKLWLVWSEDDGYRSNEGVDLAQEPVPELSADAKSFRLGRYRHYKGGEYEAIAVGRHSETLEEIVVYKALYGAGSVWVRPLAMFIEDVEVLGNKQRRFVYMN